MQQRNYFVALSFVCFIYIVSLLAMPTPSVAQQERVLYSFSDNGTDGFNPDAGSLIFDGCGNLYGTTFGGGTNGDGTVFELVHEVGGGWTEKVLHSFSGTDGIGPESGLISDAEGNLYGTTASGGANGAGTVFELKLEADGNWSEKVLHSFTQNGKDGVGPSSTLIFDVSGNLYGTTFYGGAAACASFSNGCGTVFELVHKAGGIWAERILHSFGDSGPDGVSPFPGVIFDSFGNLYGTTIYGGNTGPCGFGAPKGCGMAFELLPEADGSWSEKVLHNFGKTTADGFYPGAGLIFDTAGNLYGTTVGGGPYNYGTLFELTLVSNGSWKERVLHAFGNGSDGLEPGSLIFDSAGDLYGTTGFGGVYGYGTVFELRITGNGRLVEKVLHSFGNAEDGADAYAGVTFDVSGNLYSTTWQGGSNGFGTVIEVKP
jgi:uncharacterized repeat protein (TIGR03803 family)